MKKIIVAFVILMSISGLSQAVTTIESSGSWTAFHLEDAFTEVEACRVVVNFDDGYRALSINQNQESMVGYGFLISIAYFAYTKDGIMTPIETLEELQVLIDGEKIDTTDFQGFVQAAKSGRKMTFRYTKEMLGNPAGTVTETVSLSGFPKVWDAMEEVCPTKVEEVVTENVQ